MPDAPRPAFEVLPLPFDPRKVSGLSERLITSHHENNYAGAVRNLNKMGVELAKVTPETPAFVVAALRERELTFRNSKTLHEAYFGNLGGDGRIGQLVGQALSSSFGSAAIWEKQFQAAGLGLGGGSGWVVLGLEFATGLLAITGAGHHTQTLAASAPLLVMDMYEHSYHIDYGANHARYIDAFFANVQWDEVERRLQRARRAQTLLASTP